MSENVTRALEFFWFDLKWSASGSRDRFVGLKRGKQLVRNTFWFFVRADANHQCGPRQHEISSSKNFVIETQTDLSDFSQRDANVQLIIVTRWLEIFKPAFGHLKNRVLLLKGQATQP